MIENMYSFGYGPNDAFWRVVWSIDEGTIWTENFSEMSFGQIQLGMTKKQVMSIMGSPLNAKEKLINDEVWYYTRQDSGTSDFDQRWVIFNHDNKVTEIRKSFFID